MPEERLRNSKSEARKTAEYFLNQLGDEFQSHFSVNLFRSAAGKVIYKKERSSKKEQREHDFNLFLRELENYHRNNLYYRYGSGEPEVRCALRVAACAARLLEDDLFNDVDGTFGGKPELRFRLLNGAIAFRKHLKPVDKGAHDELIIARIKELYTTGYPQSVKMGMPYIQKIWDFLKEQENKKTGSTETEREKEARNTIHQIETGVAKLVGVVTAEMERQVEGGAISSMIAEVRDLMSDVGVLMDPRDGSGFYKRLEESILDMIKNYAEMRAKELGIHITFRREGIGLVPDGDPGQQEQVFVQFFENSDRLDLVMDHIDVLFDHWSIREFPTYGQYVPSDAGNRSGWLKENGSEMEFIARLRGEFETDKSRLAGIHFMQPKETEEEGGEGEVVKKVKEPEELDLLELLNFDTFPCFEVVGNNERLSFHDLRSGRALSSQNLGNAGPATYVYFSEKYAKASKASPEVQKRLAGQLAKFIRQNQRKIVSSFRDQVRKNSPKGLGKIQESLDDFTRLQSQRLDLTILQNLRHQLIENLKAIAKAVLNEGRPGAFKKLKDSHRKNLSAAKKKQGTNGLIELKTNYLQKLYGLQTGTDLDEISIDDFRHFCDVDIPIDSEVLEAILAHLIARIVARDTKKRTDAFEDPEDLQNYEVMVRAEIERHLDENMIRYGQHSLEDELYRVFLDGLSFKLVKEVGGSNHEAKTKEEHVAHHIQSFAAVLDSFKETLQKSSKKGSGNPNTIAFSYLRLRTTAKCLNEKGSEMSSDSAVSNSLTLLNTSLVNMENEWRFFYKPSKFVEEFNAMLKDHTQNFGDIGTQVFDQGLEFKSVFDQIMAA